MRVLIIGATGLLGRVLIEEWDSDKVTGAGSRDADIRDRSHVAGLFARLRPEYTILAAAYTDVDGCEKDPERAYGVNRDGAVNVAQAARDVGSQLMFLSTDYVFDGSKTTPYEPGDPVNPLSIYGRSKAEAEEGIRRVLPTACILRTSWIFGANKSGFASAILERARSQNKVSVVQDQRGGPTFNRDLARAIIRLVAARAEGTLHVANAGECSRYEFACELVRAAGLTAATLDPVTSDQFPRSARRPRYSALSVKGVQKYGVFMRPWQQTLGDYFLDWSAEHAGKAVTI